MFVDRIVIGYTIWVAILVAVLRENVPQWPEILGFHGLVVLSIFLLPPRGARWERERAERSWKRNVRRVAKFLRHTYLLLVMIFFFEEVEHTVNALWPRDPYWFESQLYALDRAVFGELPSILLNPFVGLPQDELMHAFYFSYYFVVIGGVVLAWKGQGEPRPDRGFETTLASTVTAFLLCFLWYPFLPARGPWENEALMARLTPFEGLIFVPAVEALIDKGAVSGGCFPSSHVGASWAVVLGLARFHRQAALVCGLFVIGLSLACVYTRYHHGLDVPAGFLAGVAGFAIASLVYRKR
jgi:membrane-associated phospholipid phosphatase